MSGDTLDELFCSERAGSPRTGSTEAVKRKELRISSSFSCG